MLFTHDTDVSLQSMAALVNTGRQSSGEQLAGPAEVAEFVRTWQITGRVDGTAAELDAVRALRPRLADFFAGDEPLVVARVNELLAEFRALPQLVEHDHWGYHLHATARDAPLHARMAVESAMAMADAVRLGQLDRFLVCAAPDCRDVLVDLSRNSSRRFCDSTCANRVNVAAFRARQGRGRTTRPAGSGRPAVR